MSTPSFDDLTPPDELAPAWPPMYYERKDVIAAYRAGALHGWEQARQLWPEPITHRHPTHEDADECGFVQFFNGAGWGLVKWHDYHNHYDWSHTPRWQPRQPSLQEQALAALDRSCTATDEDRRLIRRALEQAGEGVE